jgi:hypothetical protein
VRHVETLYLDMIARARHYIYIENQYFTSERIGEALAARLADAEGPEVVLVTRKLSHGWLEEATMSVLRTRLVRKLRAVDRHGRFHAYCPHVAGLPEGTCVDLHSKVTIVDDEWLRIGSSNISNRSMGVDTECDVTIEAQGDERVQRVIRAFRDRLLAEHTGASVEETTSAIARAGNIARAIEKLGSDARRLETLDAPELPEGVLGIASIGDPEQPVSLEGLVRQIAPDTSGKRIASGPIIVGIAILVAVALALVWRLTPLADIVTPSSMIAWAKSVADYWWAPFAVIVSYTPASLLMFPRWLITLTAVAIFGPLGRFRLCANRRHVGRALRLRDRQAHQPQYGAARGRPANQSVDPTAAAARPHRRHDGSSRAHRALHGCQRGDGRNADPASSFHHWHRPRYASGVARDDRSWRSIHRGDLRTDTCQLRDRRDCGARARDDRLRQPTLAAARRRQGSEQAWLIRRRVTDGPNRRAGR